MLSILRDMAESEELKSLLMKVEEESEKVGLKLNIPASPCSMHDTGCLGLVRWDDPEGWYGEGGGFRMGNTCTPVADSFLIFKNKIIIIKKEEKSKDESKDINN